MVFTTEGFLEVAIESLPEWDLNPQPLNSVQTLQPTLRRSNVCMYLFMYLCMYKIQKREECKTRFM